MAGLTPLLLLGLAAFVSADTPANCSYPHFLGKWDFHESAMTFTGKENCTLFNWKAEAKQVRQVQLMFPDLALDLETRSEGRWTLIYNQGVEVVFPDRTYFAFSDWKMNGKHVTSLCDRFKNGWAHTSTLAEMPKKWSCYKGMKSSDNSAPLPNPTTVLPEDDMMDGQEYNKVMDTDKVASHINSASSTWKAESYADLHSGYSVADMKKRAGGVRAHLPPTQPASQRIKAQAAALPKSWDWRTSAGPNRVPPVRNQLACGSCYSFASCEMMESRVRITTKAQLQPVFSPQDVIGCSNYSQGCEGGFAYLIAGKYGHDFGLVEEHCAPYRGVDTACITNSTCERWTTTAYYYVGGFWGACNAELMMLELVNVGPVAVAFNVTNEFFHYKKGIYQQNTTLLSEATRVGRGPNGAGSNFDPWEPLNHAVLVVGYGEENGVKYWTVMNSWSTKWGEDGYFRILRGVNELGIESSASSAWPKI